MCVYRRVGGYHLTLPRVAAGVSYHPNVTVMADSRPRITGVGQFPAKYYYRALPWWLIPIHEENTVLASIQPENTLNCRAG